MTSVPQCMDLLVLTQWKRLIQISFYGKKHNNQPSSRYWRTSSTALLSWIGSHRFLQRMSCSQQGVLKLFSRGPGGKPCKDWASSARTRIVFACFFLFLIGCYPTLITLISISRSWLAMAMTAVPSKNRFRDGSSRSLVNQSRADLQEPPLTLVTSTTFSKLHTWPPRWPRPGINPSSSLSNSVRVSSGLPFEIIQGVVA